MTFTRPFLLPSLFAGVGVLAFACSFDLGPKVSYTGGTGGIDGAAGAPANLPDGLGIGQDCSELACRPGLACVEDVCQPAGATPLGGPCLIAPECAEDLQCVGGACVPAGEGDAGDACTSDASCQAGLRCGLVGLATACVPAGTSDFGDVCERHEECFAGLYCSEGACSLPEPPFGIPLWKGDACEDSEPGPVKAYFEVPGAAGADEGDFFRLPFPNDIRLKSGKPDLSGFPTPGPALLGVDLVKAYVDKLQAEADGWGANGSVFFRFSGPIDFDTLRFDDGKRPVVLVDLTAGDPVDRLGIAWGAGAGRTSYVCPNWLGVRSGLGAPLHAEHTYAVWITTDARTTDGDAVERSDNFAAMLDDAAPADAELAAAHARYAPLRSYLADHSIPTSSLLNATVFTVGSTRDPMTALAAAAESADAPTSKDWVKCGDGAASPCSQAAGDRGCGEGTAEYDEYQALVSLPIFQTGTAPYETSGGAIAGSEVRREDVCLSLTVPKSSTMPDDGWPLVVYAHGTGGSFRSHVRPEVAGVLAEATPAFAVLGIDQVQHGPRRGSSTGSPENLFFNFANPDAARGNPLQGAADQLSLYRFASTLNLSADDTGADAIRVDAARIVFYGHSQGSTHGSLMLPLSEYPGAVLSGNGGSLIHSLLTKTQPVNIAGALPLLIQDPTPQGQLAMGDMHPALSMLQHWIDPADPLTWASAAARAPLAGSLPKHVLQTFGLGDTYSPPKTLSAYSLAAGLALASHPAGTQPEGDDVIGLTPAGGAVSGNIDIDDALATAVVRQYAPPSGRDGHFVVFDVAAARQDVVDFLAASAQGTLPSVP